MSAAGVVREPAAALPVVFYDGECGLCHRTVRFVIARDPEGRAFRFAALGSETFERRIPEARRRDLPDSVVILDVDDTLHLRSDAAIFLLERLGGGSRFWARLLRWLPRPLRDAGYDLVAAVRKKIWSQPVDACPVGSPELRARFDP